MAKASVDEEQDAVDVALKIKQNLPSRGEFRAVRERCALDAPLELTAGCSIVLWNRADMFVDIIRRKAILRLDDNHIRQLLA